MLGSSITCRIAVDPIEDRKVFSLQSLPPAGSLKESKARVARVAGFPLRAGVVAARHERQKLERLCRYITCPTIAGPVADAFRECSLTVEQAIKTLDRSGYHRPVSSDVDVASCG